MVAVSSQGLEQPGVFASTCGTKRPEVRVVRAHLTQPLTRQLYSNKMSLKEEVREALINDKAFACPIAMRYDQGTNEVAVLTRHAEWHGTLQEHTQKRTAQVVAMVLRCVLSLKFPTRLMLVCLLSGWLLIVGERCAA